MGPLSSSSLTSPPAGAPTSQPIGVCLLDAAGRVLTSDASFVQLLGVEPRAGQPLSRSIPELPSTIERELVLRCVHEGETLELRCKPIQPPQGPVARVVTLTLAGPSALTRELRAARQTLRSLIDASPIAILTLGLDKRVSMWNRAGEQMFGWTADELIGQPYPLVASEDLAAFDRLFARVIAGEGFTGIDATRLRKDGSTIEVRMHTAPLRDADGRVIGALALLEDLSETRKLEQRVRQSQKMEAIGQLAGGVAHDFNNLLSVILGMSELLALEPEVGPRAREQIEEIRRCAESARKVTAQLLTFGRREVVQPQTSDLHQLIKDDLQLLRRLIGDSIEIQLELAPGPAWVYIDPAQFDQILLNLAVNARDAMPEGGLLRVQTRRVLAAEDELAGPDDPDWLELSVIDTGTGIAPEILPHVFEPFFTTKQPGQGTGLGLATVYGITSAAGGSIEVDSRPGDGACFRICLPLATDVPTQAPPASRATVPRGNERLLLVDDEPSVRRSTAKLLTSLGYTVEAMDSGRAALDWLASSDTSIDLLLTDLSMPQMGGDQLAALVHQRLPDLPIVFMSGNLESDQLRCDIAAGRAVFLQKPVTLVALASCVRQVLDMARARA